jgi:hypothetical protein
MTTIKVLTPTLKGGYAPIIAYYNNNKPDSWMPLRIASVAEGGFEIPLKRKELKHRAEWCSRLSGGAYYPPNTAEEDDDSYRLDYNDKVKQVRWNDGRLESGFYIPFDQEETALLFLALNNSLGDANVRMV